MLKTTKKAQCSSMECIIDQRLLEILCCPANHNNTACHGELKDSYGELRCTCCGSIYPIRDGIPVMTRRQN